MLGSSLFLVGCLSRAVLRPINKQNEENLKNMTTNLQIVADTYIPVMSSYLDFKIQQAKVKKQNELLAGGTRLSPEAQIQLEFFVRDQQSAKKEVLQLLQDLFTTLKGQSEIAAVHLEAYKTFAESGKLTDTLTTELQDSNLQLKALALLKMDPTKAKKIQDLLQQFQ
jgi:hypothetical protein